MRRRQLMLGAAIVLVLLGILIAPLALEERETLWGIDARSGRPLWQRDATETPKRDQLDVEAAGGVAYTIETFGWPDHRIVVTALDPANGAPRWTRTLTGELPADIPNKMLATSSGLLLNTVPVRGPDTRTVQLLDTTGATRWRLQGKLAFARPGRGVENQLVLFDRTNGALRITTLASDTGQAQQAGALPADAFERYSIAEYLTLSTPQGLLYAHGDQIALLDVTTALTRVLPLRANGIANAGDMLFGISTNANAVQAYNLATGAPAWQLPLATTSNIVDQRIHDAQATPDGFALLVVDSPELKKAALFGTDATGAPRWRRDLPEPSWGASRLFVTRDGAVIMRSRDTFLAVRAADGATLWSGTFESFLSATAFDEQNGVVMTLGRAARWRAWLYFLGVLQGI